MFEHNTRVVVCAVAMALVGCGDGDNDNRNGDTGPRTPPLDWFTSDCGDLGGVATPAGACFIGCEQNEDCPLDLTCRSAGVWFVGLCTVPSSVSESRGCGPSGWHTRVWGCYLECSAEGADQECPAGFRCIEDSNVDNEYFCTGYSGSTGSSCSVPCPDGCCSNTGYSCCQPPFCGGICVGSSCC
jgi:hypothetical protein